MKKIISLIIFVVLALALSVTAFAADIIASGYCGGEGDGTNLMWKIDSEGTLTISGNGKMADYAFDYDLISTAPWSEYRDEIKKLVIEEGVTRTGAYSFSGLSVNALSLADSIEEIGCYSFSLLMYDGEITLPKNLKIIDGQAFDHAKFLSGTLVIPEGVTYIGWDAFHSTNFTKIVISKSVALIDAGAFANTRKLEEIVVDAENANYHVTNNALYTKDGKTLVLYLHHNSSESYTVPDGTETIFDGAFFAGGRPNSVLTTVVLPESVKKVGNYSFSATNIRFIFFNGNAPKIYEFSFDADITVYYPSGNSTWEVTDGKWNGLNAAAFDVWGYCGGEGEGKNLIWTLDADGTLTISGEGAMADFKKGWNNDRSEYIITTPWHEYKDNIKTLVIENGVTSVGKNAFYEFENFEGTLVIPETVSEIGDFAFYRCGFDTNLTIPGNVKIIGESAFSDWRITYTYGKLTVCEGVEVIKSGAFSFSHFDSAEIPSTVHTIGTGIFQFGMVLEDLVISEENDYYAAEDKIIYTKDKTKLLECLMTKTGEYTVPETVTEICDEAFWNTGLASVTVPENVKTIGEGAFERCYYDVYIWAELESIGARAFNLNYGSSDVYFFGAAPKKVESGNSNSYWNSFSDEYVNIYYIEGKEGWDLDENGLWNGFKVHPYVPGEEVELDPSLYIDSGYCGADWSVGGKNIAWGLDSEGTLTIFGKGEMADYDSFDKYGKEEVISSVSMFSVNRKTEAMPFGGGEITNPSSNPAPWHIYEGKIKKLVLEEGITKIGVYAFWGMDIPGELSIPESVKVIDDWSFCANKFKGENLVIPEGVERIGVAAFQGAGFFKNAYIPASVTDVHKPPFRYCETENIFVDEDNEYYKSVDGILFSKDGKEIIQFPDGRTGSYILPETVTVISTSAFEDSALSEITVKGNIEYIEGGAFQVYNGAIIFEGKVGEVYNGAFRPHDWAGEKQEIIFMAGPPEAIRISENWGSFNDGCEIYYLSGTEDLWEFDENGLWNGYEVKPFSFLKCGDLDGNGKVNVLDANIVRRASARLLELDYAQELAADVDSNGKVNVLDANLIRRYSAKLIDKFPAEG